MTVPVSTTGPLLLGVKETANGYRAVTVSLSVCNRISVILGATDSQGYDANSAALTVIQHIKALKGTLS